MRNSTWYSINFKMKLSSNIFLLYILYLFLEQKPEGANDASDVVPYRDSVSLRVEASKNLLWNLFKNQIGARLRFHPQGHQTEQFRHWAQGWSGEGSHRPHPRFRTHEAFCFEGRRFWRSLWRQLQKNGKWVARRARGTAEFRGTLRYCSPNVHDKQEQGRRDDLWGLLYVLIEFHCGLPWQKITDKHKVEMEALKRK